MRKIGLTIAIIALTAAATLDLSTRFLDDRYAPHPTTKHLIPPSEKIQTKDDAKAPAAVPNDLKANMEAATLALYAQIEGQTRFICTLTLIQAQASGGYIGLTAKHCTTIANVDTYFVRVQNDDDRPFVRAQFLLAGQYDCALFKVNLPAGLPVIPVGVDNTLSLGDEVWNVGIPMNVGHLFFKGSVVELRGEDTLGKFSDRIVFELPAAGGSSGSAIVDPKQGAIVAVLTHILIPSNGGVLVTLGTPAAHIREMLQAYNTGEVAPNHLPDFFSHLFDPKR
jgi:hypothetical protein